MSHGQPASNCSLNGIFTLGRGWLAVPPQHSNTVCLVGEGFLQLYWNDMAENSFGTRSPSVWFAIMAISKIWKKKKKEKKKEKRKRKKKLKLCFCEWIFEKDQRLHRLLRLFSPICCDSRCDFTSPLPSITLPNLSLVPDKVFICITWKPSLDPVNKQGCLSTTLWRKDSMETQVPGSGAWVV